MVIHAGSITEFEGEKSLIATTKYIYNKRGEREGCRQTDRHRQRGREKERDRQRQTGREREREERLTDTGTEHTAEYTSSQRSVGKMNHCVGDLSKL